MPRHLPHLLHDGVPKSMGQRGDEILPQAARAPHLSGLNMQRLIDDHFIEVYQNRC
jgi:hypothetical protein